MQTYEDYIKTIKILLVDDDEDFLDIAEVYLKMKGYNVDIAKNGNEALDILKNGEHEILLLDYYMPGITGEEVVNEIRKYNNELIIILQTGFSGQKPPIETMKNLNIQNYHDKTEGMDKLNLEIVSAVKIFEQQHKIELSKYRTNAIGKLMSSVAAEIKSSLMRISAGLEVTNMIVKDDKKAITEENVEKLNKFYSSNKESLENIDKIITAIVKEASQENNDIMQDSEIMEAANLIVRSELKSKNLNFKASSMLRNTSYLTGSINDIMFIVCEIVLKASDKISEGDNIEFILTEDEEKWYFKVNIERDNIFTNQFISIYKNILFSIPKTNIHIEENSVIISLAKK